jgi:Lon protease-like protein
MSAAYRKTSDLPSVIAVFPLNGALLLPGGVLPLQIFEPRYLNMVDDVMRGDRLIGMIQTIPGGPRHTPHLAEVGCAGRITSYSETGDGTSLIALTGVCRFEVLAELEVRTPYRQVRAAFGPFHVDLAPDPDLEPFERPAFLALLRRYLERRQLGVEWEVISSAPAAALINSLAMALPFSTAEKQALLEARDLEARRHTLSALLEMGSVLGEDDDSPPIQ